VSLDAGIAREPRTWQVFKKSPDEPPNSTVDSGIEVLTLVLALVMSESAIDSLQNGIAATISSTFLRGRPMHYARITVVLINVVIIPFALANYNVLSLFLSANMLGCCWFLPCLVGGFWDTPTGRKVYSETTVVLGSWITIVLVCIYGIVDGPKQCAALANAGVLWEPYHDVCQCASAAQLGELALEVTGKVNCASAGTRWAWVGQPYMYQYFLFVSFVSLGISSFLGLINLLLPDTLPGITDVLGLSSLRYVAPSDADVVPTKVVPDEMVSVGPTPTAMVMQPMATVTGESGFAQPILQSMPPIGQSFQYMPTNGQSFQYMPPNGQSFGHHWLPQAYGNNMMQPQQGLQTGFA
jgi:hypothetical protein